ncbi:MAG TPA: bifunctional phosphopantothenoylcysteine decarboxylase/phosphopantothenate--cysteine ligase CoaBC [Vicinamibacterales bacterium]
MALIALGVSGGIGAYKAVEVARGLQKAGHDVVAVMTRSARRFVGEVTFEAITRHPVVTTQWRPGANADIEHIRLASDIALLLIAPATANIIGKMAGGIADDFLSALYLATPAPVLIAPAMNSNMLAHPAVQRNLEILTSRGVQVVEPGEGYLACGWIGRGRLAEPADVVAAAERVLAGAGTLAGRRILVTAGPTCEDIDPVRFVGNRSSGRMGYAIAAEAARRGAAVTLITGPTALTPPPVELVRVRSAAEMHRAVHERLAGADALIMAAAVANYTPEAPAAQKLPHDASELVLRLKPTADILADAAAWRARERRSSPLLVGFAAETHDVVPRARAKREKKGIDVIVANDVSRTDAGFEVDANVVTIIGPGGEETVPLASKRAVAATIVDRLESWLSSRAQTPTRA